MSPIQRLNLQQLLYLQALIEERHVTRAAERVGIGQPAMSTALARLREVFKDPLLVKTTSGMEPTSRAMEIVRRIQEVTDLLEGKGFADGSFDLSTASSHWRLMASDSICRNVLPALMNEVGEKAPRMRFTVQAADPRRVSEHLRNGDFDLAISFFRNAPAELRQVKLYPTSILCIARKGHPDIRGRISLSQFTTTEHVRSGAAPATSTIETVVDEALESLGLSRPIRLLVGSPTLIPSIVANSDLIAITSERFIRTVDTSHELQVLKLPFKVSYADISMLWHERLHHDPAHKWLRSVVQRITQAKI